MNKTESTLARYFIAGKFTMLNHAQAVALPPSVSGHQIRSVFLKLGDCNKGHSSCKLSTMSKSRSLGRGTIIHKIELEPVATPSWRLAATASSGAGQGTEMVAFLKEGSGRRCVS